MERQLLSQKIESLRRCVLRIEQKLPQDATALCTDFDLQDIIAVNIERAVQQCIDIAAHILADYDDVSGQSAASLFTDLVTKELLPAAIGQRLSRAAGLRNLLVHRYADIDWARVHQSLSSDLEVFAAFAGELSVKFAL